MGSESTSVSSSAEAASKGIRKGRFETGMDPFFASFNASISFDKRLFVEDIEGSLAHVTMLGKMNIIPEQDAETIRQGLLETLEEFKAGKFHFKEELEDVHINIEDALKQKIGSVAGKLHTARSRNDQIALDLRLYLKKSSLHVMKSLLDLMSAFLEQAETNIEIIMPGYTHLQRAQPVRLSHHLMAYFQMFRRDFERYRGAMERIDEMPLGSAALAGTTYKTDPLMVAELLGFSKVSANSMDAVSDRDFAVEFVSNSAMTMTHLSRLAEELIIWSSSEFGFCELPDAYCSGSSIMPQKKNPDACELVRAKTGRVLGDLTSLMTTLKGLPLTYNKDLQEDKEPVFDALDTVLGSLKIMASLVSQTVFDSVRMFSAASEPYLAATDLADDLVRSGLPFRDAHARVGALIRNGGQSEKALDEMKLATPEQMVEARTQSGATSKASVINQIATGRKFVADAEQSAEFQKLGKAIKGNR